MIQMKFQYENFYTIRGKMRAIIMAILLAAVLFLLSGCAGCPECGAIRRDNEVTTVFTSETIVPEYRYFYNLAIRRFYQLRFQLG